MFNLKKNILNYLNNDTFQQVLLYTVIVIIILSSVYIFFSFYTEIFLTLIFIVLVFIYKELKKK